MLLTAALVFSVQPYWGVGDGELDWSIASDLSGAATPNVLSELEFQNLDTRELGVKMRLSAGVFWDGFEVFLEGDASAGSIESGSVIDADYDGDNRTDLWSLSKSSVEGDDIDNALGSFGMSYAFNPQHKLSVLIGGYYSEQAINFQYGVQLVAEPPKINTSLDVLTDYLQEHLNSDYKTEWQGGWGGLEYQFNWQRWSIRTRAAYFIGTYYGEGRWNLRAEGQNPLEQPKSFSHAADSTGIQLQLGLGYQLTENIGLHLDWQSDDWESDTGSATTYFADDTLGHTQFNGAQWESSVFELGVSYTFQ